MNWTTLNPINIEDFFGAETKTKAEALNVRIAALLAGRAALDSDGQAFRDSAAELGGKALKRKQDLKVRELDLLTEEIEIREGLAAFDSMRSADAAAASNEAYTAIEKTQADLRKKLVKIGYVDAPPELQVAGKITPGMILSHPNVLAARQRHEFLVGQSRATDGRVENQKALEQVRQAVALACR
jgi:hypothetical protein